MSDIRSLDHRRILVAPSLLAADFTRLAEEIRRVEDAGADLLHCDVMDGCFVPNISFGQPVVESIHKCARLPLDVHLMITRPARYAESFAAAGASHITFHVESDDEPDAVIAAIRKCGCTVGLSLKPKTPAAAVLPYLDRVDLILVMTVEPGFGGQKFMADQMDKLAELRRAIDASGRPIHLEVDGGVGGTTVETVAAHGGNMLVAGTSVFRNAAGAAEAIAELHRAQAIFASAI